MNFRGAVNLFQMRWVKPLPMQCNGCSGVVKTSPMFSNWWCQRTFRKQKDFQIRTAEKVAKTKASHGWNFYSAGFRSSHVQQTSEPILGTRCIQVKMQGFGDLDSANCREETA